jgi:hypothetical protein
MTTVRAKLLEKAAQGARSEERRSDLRRATPQVTVLLEQDGRLPRAFDQQRCQGDPLLFVEVGRERSVEAAPSIRGLVARAGLQGRDDRGKQRLELGMVRGARRGFVWLGGHVSRS